MIFGRLAKGVGIVIAAAGAIVTGLLIATAGPQAIATTVADDPALPVIDLPDVRLHGRLVGPDDAPLIIVLHGGPGGDHRSLTALAALADTHRVLLFDQRGAGLSARVDADALTTADYLRDIDALADRYAPDAPVILVGHSWGAMLAVAYMGHRPERVARAVLIEPGFLDPVGYAAWEVTRDRLARSPRVFATGLMAGLRARHVAGQDAAAGRDFVVGAVVHAFADHPDNPYHCPGRSYAAPGWRFGAAASDVFWADPWPMIAAMRAGTGAALPVLLLAGGCNSWTGPALQGVHAGLFADARVITIAGAGHDVIWDKPDETLAHVRAFLR